MLVSCFLWDSFRAAAEGQAGCPGATGSSVDPVSYPIWLSAALCPKALHVCILVTELSLSSLTSGYYTTHWSHLSLGHKLPVWNLGGEIYQRTRATKHWLSPALEQAAHSPFGSQEMAVALFTWWEQDSFCSCPSSLPMNGAEEEFGGERITGSLLQPAPFEEEKGGHWKLAVKIRICT